MGEFEGLTPSTRKITIKEFHIFRLSGGKIVGTNVPGLGFTVTYAPQPDRLWFPVTFSTEFRIKVLFFFNRQIILDAQNRNFEKTHVTSRIVGDAKEVKPQ